MVFLLLVIIIIIIINFFRRVFSECTEAVTTSLIPPIFLRFVLLLLALRMLTKFVSIGSYSPEVCTFGTLIMSTKVFSFIICKTL